MNRIIGKLKENKKASAAVQNTVAIILALVIWQAAAMSVGREILLASPISVIKTLFGIITDSSFLSTVLFSSMRIALGFFAAVLGGIILAVISGYVHIVEVLLRPYVVAIKTIPVASFIILCLIWFSYSHLTILISFLIAFPVIYSNVLQGIKSTPEKMKELAKLYKIGVWRQLLYIYIPSVKPYLISACGVCVGMAWKAGVAGEVIGVLDGSIGERLYEAKIYFENAELLAWTIVIILLSVIGEKLFVFLLKRLFALLERI